MEMNIIEAWKTGKRFRHKSWRPNLWFPHEEKTFVINGIEIERDDLFRDEFEIEEEKIEITKEQFSKAFNEMLEIVKTGKMLADSPEDCLASRLGFKE